MRVERIGFTPVKGGRHVAHERVDLALTGPVGDRVFCLVDMARGRVLRTVENPTLLQTVSRRQDGVLTVQLPGTTVAAVPVGTGSLHPVDYWGRRVHVELVDGPWAAAYSRFLGYPVVLARPLSPGGVVYGAPVSIVTTQAMRWVNQRLGRPAQPERFRPTFVIDSGHGAGRGENAWLGRELRIGQARLRVRAVMPRCAVIDLDPQTGRRDAPVLKALARPGGPASIEFGIDAVVTAPGRVCLGDSLHWEPDQAACTSRPAAAP
jgi:uncharacterized protein YcbX